MLQSPQADTSTYGAVVVRLLKEFGATHQPLTVVRCVEAARHGAEDVLRESSPATVERIARQHLHILARVHSQE